MKKEWKLILEVGVGVFLLYLCIHYWDLLVNVFLTVLGAASPLLLGCLIAYLVNILMNFYERKVFSRWNGKGFAKRVVCLVLAIFSLLAVVALVVTLVVPELVSCVQLLIAEIPPLLDRIIDSEIVQEVMPEDLKATLSNLDWNSIFNQVRNFLTSGITTTIATVANAVTSVVSATVTAVLGFIFALYLLIGKDTLTRQADRILKTYLKETWYDRIRYLLGVFNDCFRRYIVGQCMEAVILGVLCIIGMTIFRFPYAPMIGALVGFTALIPVAGAYIGAGVGFVMILTVSPIRALLFLVFIVVLQQLEGNLIYPKVVGSSIGLPGIWVLAAVTVGGSLGGIMGMLVGVPLAAACYRILREDVNRRGIARGVETGERRDENRTSE